MNKKYILIGLKILILSANANILSAEKSKPASLQEPTVSAAILNAADKFNVNKGYIHNNLVISPSYSDNHPNYFETYIAGTIEELTNPSQNMTGDGSVKYDRLWQSILIEKIGFDEFYKGVKLRTKILLAIEKAKENKVVFKGNYLPKAPFYIRWLHLDNDNYYCNLYNKMRLNEKKRASIKIDEQTKCYDPMPYGGDINEKYQFIKCKTALNPEDLENI